LSRPTSGADAPAAALVRYERDGIVIATWRNVGIVLWGSRATVDSTRALGAACAEMLKLQSKISIVQVIPDKVPTPADDVRAALAKLTEIGAPSLACLAYVLSGDGFWASVMRSYLTNVHWLSERPFVTRICPTLEEAANWMPSLHRQHTGVAVDSGVLLEVLKACTTGRVRVDM
jgi:hypothetical protein